MKSEATRIWRLALPDDWQPEGYWCVSFAIPADRQYVDALAAVLGLLTISKTFERDETHTGASIVAKTWRDALMLQPMAVNETCDPIPVPPIPDAAAAADAAAAFWNTFLIPRVVALNACATDPGDCAGCVDTMMTELTPYGASSAVRGALMQLCTDLNELTTEQREAYEEQCVYLDQFESISDQIENNPYDWLNQLSDWLFDWLDQTSDRILYDLNVVAGLLGGNGLYSYIDDNGGITAGGGASFGSTCEWTHTLDFAIEEYGFEPSTALGQGDRAVYVASVGWDSVYKVYSGVHTRICEVQITLPNNIDVRDLIMTYNATEGDTGSGSPLVAEMYGSGGLLATQALGNGSGQTIEFHDTEGVTTNAFDLFLRVGSHLVPVDPGGMGVIVSIQITAVGTDPWPDAPA